jgi:hypothetical protein
MISASCLKPGRIGLKVIVTLQFVVAPTVQLGVPA